ncbi:PREDICTED: UDP-N-acetylhexosamine pyrophosphorylase [Ceratosolen solmsi marchali]|uniref:UDP-N-acetylglucosamine diphosphorylase n=1 Tax=Ceratosolen solmsi marchali TaxID=326594 RepID=A0AAJ6YDV9_9HYME|nr:PREDICTED: UDP-N-acetylhexosamine pyrophosphorylase [Ceratosolen solmsi marchali]
MCNMIHSQLKSLLEKYHQEHLLQFWNELSENEKEYLFNDIMNLNISEMISQFNKATAFNNNKKHLLDNKIKPIPTNVMESIQNLLMDNVLLYEKLGLQEIADGKVAVILLAGGQGTRLGVDFPKGMYNICLPSNRTLFEIQALRIRSLQNLAKDKFGKSKDITWYIMTSDATHELTVAYFESNKYFGLNKNNIIAFKQNTMPCFTLDGKIILDEKYRISRAPDGNGGLYIALKKEGILIDMKKRGINSVHVYSVDNVLVKVADPMFLGFCISREADCGVKAVIKRSVDEPVGIICQIDGLYTVAEYSEISTDTAKLRDNKGNLIFRSGNICNHYFTLAFLNNISENYEKNLDLHIANKKIPFIDKNGEKSKPNIPNGVKIEKFVFDVFKYSTKFVVWEVSREDEFSALKNSNIMKIDCPLTTRNDLLRLHKKWLLNSGATRVEGDVEICPLISYGGENLIEIVKNTSFEGPMCLKMP